MLKGYRTLIFNLIMGVVMIFKAAAPDLEAPSVDAVNHGLDALDVILSFGWMIGNFVLRAITTSPIFRKNTDDSVKLSKTGASLIVLLLCLCLLAGCAGHGMKSFSEMSPKERATFFMRIYKSQFDNYQTQSAVKDLAPEQIKILRAKRDLLKQMYPLVRSYDMVVTAGGIPDPESEQEILELIDLLTA